MPLTAKDVAFTYNYVVENEMSNYTAYTNLIDKATAIDDYTVEFVCSKPKPDMIRHWLPILPEHIWSKISPKEAGQSYQNTPPYVGSGPFKCRGVEEEQLRPSRRQPQLVGPEARRSTRSTSRTTPTATPCCRTSRPATSTAPAT